MLRSFFTVIPKIYYGKEQMCFLRQREVIAGRLLRALAGRGGYLPASKDETSPLTSRLSSTR